jgi:hypothetical protein
MGDIFVPNFIERADRLGQSNYHQFMVGKKFGSRVKASVDYTWDKGTDTMREAFLVRVPETRIFDSARVEVYQRTNDVTFGGSRFDRGSGYAFTGSNAIHKKFLLEGGYASVDENYTAYTGSGVLGAVNFSLNGDAYGTGNRVFTRANYKFTPYFSIFGFYTHEVNTNFYNWTRQGLNAGVVIDFKGLPSDKLHLL